MDKEIPIHPLKQAREFMLQGSYQQAVAEYKRVIQATAIDISIYHDIALVYLKYGFKHLALDYFYRCGFACITCRLLSKAQEILEEMNAIDPLSHYAEALESELSLARQL